MADYNNNAAYDLSRFAPAKGKTAPGRQNENLPVKPEVLKEKIKSARQSRLEKKSRQQKLLKVVSVCISLLLLAGLKLSGNVKISQQDRQLRQETALLNTAQSESIRLTTEMEKQYSFDQVQNFSKLNGLQKSERYQIFYVNNLTKDKVTNYLGKPAI